MQGLVVEIKEMIDDEINRRAEKLKKTRGFIRWQEIKLEQVKN